MVGLLVSNYLRCPQDAVHHGFMDWISEKIYNVVNIDDMHCYSSIATRWQAGESCDTRRMTLYT